MAGRHSRKGAADPSSIAFNEMLLACSKSKRFDELKAQLATVDRVDATSDVVLEAFFRVIQAADLAVIDRFFSLGIDPNTRWRNNTALGGAARMGNPALVAALVERGCDVNAPGLDDNTPVVGACFSACRLGISAQLRPRFEETVSLLLKLGSDPNRANMFRCTALDYACQPSVGWIGLVEILLKEGARLERASEGGADCMNNAAMLLSPDLLRLLLARGGNPNCRNHTGTTPLMLAAVFGRGANVNLLLESGADVRATDIGGLSALDHARKHGHLGLIPVLEAAAGNSL
jgi:ankyrin repeat protein